jgi:hypothetical protein
MTERSETAGEWRPIETAPFNRSILIFIPHSQHYGPGVWKAIYVDMGSGKRWTSTGLHVGRDLGVGYEPTHWMPLPEPPL